MTVDSEWLVYFGMYYKDFTAMLEKTTGKMTGMNLIRFFTYPAEPSAMVCIFQSSEDLSYWNISASAAKEIPVTVSSLVFLFEKSFK